MKIYFSPVWNKIWTSYIRSKTQKKFWWGPEKTEYVYIYLHKTWEIKFKALHLLEIQWSLDHIFLSSMIPQIPLSDNGYNFKAGVRTTSPKLCPSAACTGNARLGSLVGSNDVNDFEELDSQSKKRFRNNNSFHYVFTCIQSDIYYPLKRSK